MTETTSVIIMVYNHFKKIIFYNLNFIYVKILDVITIHDNTTDDNNTGADNIIPCGN